MNTETKIIQLQETASTNDFLRRYEPEGEWLTVAVADYQTAGRGQGGSHWESERGKNLLFSMLVFPKMLPVRRQFLLSEAAALAFRDVLGSFLGDEEVTVKWPNDIYWKDRKLSGTLIETTLTASGMGRFIIGTGINANQTCFVGDAPNPVSMAQVLGHEVDRGQLMEKLVARFGEYYALIVDGAYADIAALYLQHLYRRDDFYKYRDSEGEFEARVVEVEDDGHLILHDRQGCIRSYAFKEVSFVI